MKSKAIHRADEAPLAEADAARLRRDPFLHGLPVTQASAAGGHLSLPELKALAAERLRMGEAWVFPHHLGVCPLCLDSFQCMLGPVPDAGEKAIRRFEGLWREAAGPARKTARIHPVPLRFLRVAAGLAILLGAATALHLATPAATPTETSQVSQLALVDGSRLTIDAHSRFAVDRSLAGSTRVRLEQGRIDASVVHQTLGRRFTVTTPLGEVRVIGTRFQVAVDSEDVTVYEKSGNMDSTRQYHAKVASVRVIVTEGIVSVQSPHDQVRVGAGQTAVIREGQPLIDVQKTFPREG